MPTLDQIIAALAEQDVSPREAQRLLAAHLRRKRRQPEAKEMTTAERARAERLEFAEEIGLYEDDHALAQAARLRRGLGWDIAPPPELE
jgi:hypothetical protein